MVRSIHIWVLTSLLMANSAAGDDLTRATAYLVTSPNSVNKTFVHIINSSESDQSFRGNLYRADGQRVGIENAQLHNGFVGKNGRLVIESEDLVSLFDIDPWSGPAILEISGSQKFDVMTKLTSPSGLVSNTNCVRQSEVHNLEGSESGIETYLRFINIGETPLGSIRGTIRDASGSIIGTQDTEFLSGLDPKQAVWLNKDKLKEAVGAAWSETASLKISLPMPNLRLLNLNFVNDETFFNFSCFESGENSRVYLITNASSKNISETHFINLGDSASNVSGSLFSSSGEALGSPGSLSDQIAPGGRAVLSANDFEDALGAETWEGPALFEIENDKNFALMTKLTSPSGLISNTNCVRETDVHNIEGSDSQDMTYIRFINQGSSSIRNITGNLYDHAGQSIGTQNKILIEALGPKEQRWINRSKLEQLFESEWTAEATLKVDAENVQELRLLNLNFVNNETFFNFSCYENSSSPGPVDALSFFTTNVSNQIVQEKCVNCHTNEGPAGGTGLKFEAGSNAETTARNLTALETFIQSSPGNSDRILDKVRGVGHGGGSQLSSSSEDYKNLVALLGLIGENVAPDNSTNEGSFWGGVGLSLPEETLRRAAIILARRVPTNEEIAAVKNASRSEMRSAVKNLMNGKGFHDFLTTGANDRLHTDAFLNGLFLDSADLNNGWFLPVGAEKYFALGDKTTLDGPPEGNWVQRWMMSMAKVPLELIAYIVENDRSYKEVVTADYMMMNPIISEILNGGIVFEDETDPLVFKPGRNQGQVVRDEQHESEFVQNYGTRIDSHGDFIEYPHAGVLNTHSFLNRYPTTDTNRNRARSRWTFYHFLGVDVEKSAARTTDPEALADTDNPTMNNPACTVCHELLDPVAGAFQNYGNDGKYRDGHLGRDALPDSYKYADQENTDGSNSYQEGDTWFRDMRTPGFDGGLVNNPDHSLSWLGERIADDPRFARAAIKFWWPAIMGSEVARAPEIATDANFSDQLTIFEEQNKFISELGESFRQGIRGGAPFNAKDLFTEMILSPWFTAKKIDPEKIQTASSTAGNIGNRRLLTPEELEAKTLSLLGSKWGSNGKEDLWQYDLEYTALGDRYGLYYGGIDSNGIRNRARAMSSLMINVAERQALEMACPAVIMDFSRADADRLLFENIEPMIEPDSESVQSYQVSAESFETSETFKHYLSVSPGKKEISISFLNDFNGGEDADRNLSITRIQISDSDGKMLLDADFSQYNQNNLIDGIGLGELNCGDYSFWEDSFKFWSNCSIEIPFETAMPGDLQVAVSAWGEQAGEDLPLLGVSVKSDAASGESTGARKIRTKIVELYSKLHGVELSENDPDIQLSYELLVSSWEGRKTIGNSRTEPWPEESCRWADWELRQELYNDDDDPTGMKYAWMSILIMLMTDFNYLHE